MSMRNKPFALIELLSASDEELSQLAINDPAAYAELYHRYYQPLYRAMVSTTGDVDAAQELTAQTFVAVLKKDSGFPEQPRLQNLALRDCWRAS